MFWKEYPNEKPSGDDAKVLADGVRVFSARFDNMFAFPKGQSRVWGAYDPQAWRDWHFSRIFWTNLCDIHEQIPAARTELGRVVIGSEGCTCI